MGSSLSKPSVAKTDKNNLAKFRKINNNNKSVTRNSNDCVYLMDPRKYQRQYNKYLNEECKLSSCPCTERLLTVLIKYDRFIQQQNQQKKDNNDGYNKSDTIQIINDFHHSISAHENEFEDIYNRLVRCNKGKICQLSNCLMRQRNFRDRNRMRTKENELAKMYFSVNNVDIVNQQILDTIHSHYYHSFDTRYKLSHKQRLEIRQRVQNLESKDEETDISDKITHSIYNMVNETKNIEIDSSFEYANINVADIADEMEKFETKNIENFEMENIKNFEMEKSDEADIEPRSELRLIKYLNKLKVNKSKTSDIVHETDFEKCDDRDSSFENDQKYSSPLRKPSVSHFRRRKSF